MTNKIVVNPANIQIVRGLFKFFATYFIVKQVYMYKFNEMLNKYWFYILLIDKTDYFNFKFISLKNGIDMAKLCKDVGDA